VSIDNGTPRGVFALLMQAILTTPPLGWATRTTFFFMKSSAALKVLIKWQVKPSNDHGSCQDGGPEVKRAANKVAPKN
jgi:hypothetical protein